MEVIDAAAFLLFRLGVFGFVAGLFVVLVPSVINAVVGAFKRMMS